MNDDDRSDNSGLPIGDGFRINEMLVAAVREGAGIKMDDADWSAIRKAARAAAAESAKSRPEPRRGDRM
jgi:hypothetical protein